MFWINKLTVTGNGKTTSTITFVKGMNVIYGPSNTGKTYIVSCIDYVFGSTALPFATNTGYDTIALQIDSEYGAITLTRKLNENSVEVSCVNSNIESGMYKLTGKQSLGAVLLNLIGIEDVPSVISSKDFKTQKLSWRNILHMSLISEERIIRKPSILMPEQKTAETSTVTALTYLATGKDFKESMPQESPTIIKAKKEAVEFYIRDELRQISERQSELNVEKNEITLMDFELEIDKITQELLQIQSRISDSLKGNQKLLGETTKLNEQLAECTIMKKRYQELKSQYVSDLDRLNFIVDSAVKSSSEHIRSCPFCSSTVKIKDSTDYIISAQSEYKKIQLQLKDLEKTINSLDNEILSLEYSLQDVMKNHKNTNMLIEQELQPYAEQLKEKLRDYRSAMRINAEIDALNNQSCRMAEKVSEIVNNDEPTLVFKAKEHIPSEMLEWFNKYWPEVLTRCKFDDLQSAYFDKRYMDVVVNGQTKADFGKGYRAYLNTLNALGMILFLKAQGKYSPSLLIVDSPILSLKEKLQSDEKVSSPMRSGLFEELKQHQEGLQIIVIENEIPSINYDNVQVIEFTKSKKYGRYGFLADLFN